MAEDGGLDPQTRRFALFSKEAGAPLHSSSMTLLYIDISISQARPSILFNWRKEGAFEAHSRLRERLVFKTNSAALADSPSLNGGTEKIRTFERLAPLLPFQGSCFSQAHTRFRIGVVGWS